MSPVEFLDIVWQIIHEHQKNVGIPEIDHLSYDGDNDSAEIIATTTEGQEFVISSEKLCDFQRPIS
jgi:hypothetical protein